MRSLRAGFGFLHSFVGRVSRNGPSFILLACTLFVLGCGGSNEHGPFGPRGAEGRAVPGAVTTLEVESAGAHEVTLTFHEVDDGAGRPATYEIRYSEAPTPHDWGSATSTYEGSCATPMVGAAVGASVTCTVEGLRAGTRYEFQLVAFRGTLNKNAVFGALSNVVEARTEGDAQPSAGPPRNLKEITRRAFHANNESGWDDNSVRIASMPGSSSKVGRITFSRGFLDGRTPGHAAAPPFSFAQVYSSFRLMFSSNWQGHDSGVNKIVFLTDESEGGGGDPVVFCAFGFGSGPLHFQVRAQGPNIEARVLEANLGSARLQRGVWHQIEVLVSMNRPGRSDGEVHVWIDGTKTHEFRNVRLVSGGSDHRFDSWRWGPVWGGNTGDVVRQNMHQYLDHIYISGK